MTTVRVICLPDTAGFRQAKLSMVIGAHVSAIEWVKEGIGACTFDFQTYAAFSLIS